MQVTTLADTLGVGVYFNLTEMAVGQVWRCPLTECDTVGHPDTGNDSLLCCRIMQDVKYGVVGLSTLLRDLSSWDSLLLAGRLHKPVLHVVRDSAVIKAVDANLQAALSTSLLLLPEAFTTQVWPTCGPSSYTAPSLSCMRSTGLHCRSYWSASVASLTWGTSAWAWLRTNRKFVA